MADALSGVIDETYNSLSSTTKDATTGQTVKSDSVTYQQRYTFLVDKTIFPKLTFVATGVFEKDVTNQKQTGQEQVTSTTTKFLPNATLTLQDPLYTAGVGFYLNEQRQAATQTPTVTLVNEDYRAFFSWRPAGLPFFDLIYDHIDTYDLSHSSTNVVNDNVSLVSHYFYRGFDFRYFGTYLEANDELHDVDTINVTHNATGAYNNAFLGGRLLFGTSYNVIYNDVTTTTAGAGGTVNVQAFPFSGLSSLSDTPALGAVGLNPALVDGNLTASAGIDIGLPSLGGNLQQRNIGLDFLNPVQVNDLQVWVDRTLTPAVAASFSWDIYTSADNLTWTLVQTVFPATFGAFQNRFDIQFAGAKTRFIKVVVRPLAATVTGASNFPNIFVTELQAFVAQTVQQSSTQKLSSRSEVSSTTARYSVFNSPLLYYESSYFFNKSSSTGLETSTLSNGFSSNYRFNSVLTGTGRFAWETGEQQNERRNAYLYNASVMATPLPTLTDSLVFSGRDETIGGKSQDTQSLFLNNTARLYKGLDVNLNAGRITSTNVDGTKLQSNTITMATNVIPHRTMTWTFAYTYTNTDHSGPGTPSTSTLTEQQTVTCAYTPFRTMYLFASLQRIDQTGQRVFTAQNYGLNWSPFPDGALQFRFSYTEQITPSAAQSTKIISPGVRYKINARSFLDLSYQSTESTSGSQITDSKAVIAELRISL